MPLCFFLSGGLDSSIIVKTASQYYKENKLGKINTYSVEYRDNEKYFKKSLFQPNADFEYISLMSRNADSRHREIILDNKAVADALYDSVIARDLPGYVDVDSSLLLFCGEIKKDYTVALSGECADELFGGYPWYHNKEILFEDNFPWSKSQDVRSSILKDGVLPKGAEYVRQKYLDTINLAPKLKTDSKTDARMREMFYLNFTGLCNVCLNEKTAVQCITDLRCVYRSATTDLRNMHTICLGKSKHIITVKKELCEKPLRIFCPKKFVGERKVLTLKPTTRYILTSVKSEL